MNNLNIVGALRPLTEPHCWILTTCIPGGTCSSGGGVYGSSSGFGFCSSTSVAKRETKQIEAIVFISKILLLKQGTDKKTLVAFKLFMCIFI